MTAKTAFAGMFLIAIIHTCLAADTSSSPDCPRSYPLDGMTLTKVPQGWVGEVDERLALQSASIAVGDPSHENEIVPTESKKTRGGALVMYDDLTGFRKQRWLVCGYGMTNVVKLYRRLGAGIKRCTMEYMPAHAGTTVQILARYRCE